MASNSGICKKSPSSDMERWSGKVAVVTGASSGIGWSIVKDLLSAKVLVVGLARRLDKMEELRIQLDDRQQRKAFQPLECDISSLVSLTNAFQKIEQQYKRVNIIINNAGMAEITALLDEGNEASLKRVIDVNLMGTVNCTKQAYRLMKLAMDEGEECHIITVNSLLGHTVPLHIPECGLNLYPVAKHALRATNEILRRELFEHKLMRLSSISPGLTETNFASNANTSESKDWEKLKLPEKILQPEDVSRGVTFILASPLHVTIAELLMVPSGEKY